MKRYVKCIKTDTEPLMGIIVKIFFLLKGYGFKRGYNKYMVL